MASGDRASAGGITDVLDATTNGALPRHIAVIEDDETLALLLRYNLEAAGYSVAAMSCGADADTRLPREPFDLAVLDWGLPLLSGIEVLRRLRSRTNRSYLPIIMLTARGDRESRQRAVVNGADVFLTKPFSLRDFMFHVERLMAEPKRAHG